jgi:hypothetical protein
VAERRPVTGLLDIFEEAGLRLGFVNLGILLSREIVVDARKRSM